MPAGVPGAGLELGVEVGGHTFADSLRRWCTRGGTPVWGTGARKAQMVTRDNSNSVKITVKNSHTSIIGWGGGGAKTPMLSDVAF